ncbi:MAG: hypothetical protein OEV28_14220, partial [Nitrospirota bacterium]|nr:hypothetical protein [Nitrospirota bacterium]
FAAYFMQQQLWATIIQVGEASRKTVKVQTINLLVAALHFLLIGALFIYDGLSVAFILALIIAEFAMASLVAWLILRAGTKGQQDERSAPLPFRQMLAKYVEYCKPLMFLSWIGFLYNFADTWMLQRFGGASQQGFYQASFQFSAISLIATSSVLNVFWKEIAEANDRGNIERVAFLYRRMNRGLMMFGSVVSGLLIPWSWHISIVFLGGSYEMAAPVMMIMFFFPIHASMGQVSGTMFLASGRTYTYFLIGAFFMLISIPISYFIQAPIKGLLIPGLGLGAIGMALKMVLINVVSVNTQAWYVSRLCKTRYEWAYQVVGIGGIVAIGYLSKTFAGLFWNLNELTNKISLILPVAVSAFVYLLLVFVFIWIVPWLAGLERDEIRSGLARISALRFRD